MGGTVWVRLQGDNGYTELGTGQSLFVIDDSGHWRIQSGGQTVASDYPSKADAMAALADLVNGREFADLD